MKSFTLITSLILLSACSTIDSNQSQKYTLVYSDGAQVSTHSSYNNCQAAAIRTNIRKTNEWNATHKSHQRVPVQDGSPKQASCK